MPSFASPLIYLAEPPILFSSIAEFSVCLAGNAKRVTTFRRLESGIRDGRTGSSSHGQRQHASSVGGGPSNVSFGTKPVGWRWIGQRDTAGSPPERVPMNVSVKASRDKIKQPERPKLRDVMGPGLITGAPDDEPSGIATYSQAGAQFGYALGWTLLLTYL